MNPKLNKVNAEIEKMEARLVETQASLKDLRAEKKQLEDLEIVKTIRAMKSTDMDVMELIKMMQEGRASVPAFSVEEEKPQRSASVYKKESEDDENEEKNYENCSVYGTLPLHEPLHGRNRFCQWWR